jgi:small redox-active disulfide protein 2
MKQIMILGTGCPNCKRLEALVREALLELGLEAQIEKVTDMADIASWGILATPGLVVDGRVVSAGRIPDRRELPGLLAGQPA